MPAPETGDDRDGAVPAAGRPMGRRPLLLAGVAAAGGVLTAGCRPFSTTAPTTTTIIAPAPRVADPMTELIALTRLHTLRLLGSIPLLTAGGDSVHAATLTALAKDRQAHFAALQVEQRRTDPSAAVIPTPLAAPAAGTLDLSQDLKLLVGAARTDAADAQQRFTDALALVSRYRATIFGSIAACLATHRAVLS